MCRALLNLPHLVPRSVAGLSHLQRACITPCHTQTGFTLPTGPWVGSLRQLSANYDSLLLSSQLLAAAGRLEQLGVLRGRFASSPLAGERFWGWCSSHPPLQRVDVVLPAHEVAPPVLLTALSSLQKARPALRMQLKSGGMDPEDEFLHRV